MVFDFGVVSGCLKNANSNKSKSSLTWNNDDSAIKEV